MSRRERAPASCHVRHQCQRQHLLISTPRTMNDVAAPHHLRNEPRLCRRFTMTRGIRGATSLMAPWQPSWICNIYVLSLYVCSSYPPNSSTDIAFMKAARLNTMLIIMFIPTHPNTRTTQAHLNSYILLNMFLLKQELASCFLQ
jgi:hypothetical protein